MSKPTNYVRAVRTIGAEIDRATRNGTGAHKTGAAMRRELALWAATSYSYETYDRLSRLENLPWKRWNRELQWPGILVACGLRLMARDGLSRAKALSVTGGPAADLDEALQLLKESGLSVHDVVAAQSEEVATTLASNLQRLHVRLEQRALEDMLLAAAEGYKVSPGKGFKYTEVFGLCFGSVRRKVVRRESQDLFVNVGRVATQMRAKATANEVTPNSKSFAAQLEIGDRFFPHLEVVGDYHTHPCATFRVLVEQKSWEHSDVDEASLPHFVDDVCKHHNAPLFGLVVAVAQGGKSGAGPIRRRPNVIQLPAGDLFFVLGAYRIRLDRTYDDQVELSLPALNK